MTHTLRTALALVFILLPALRSGAGTPPIRIVNPSFEAGAAGTAPQGWDWASAFRDAGYTAHVTAGGLAGRKCAVIAGGLRIGPPRFGVLQQLLDATPYRGKQIRLRSAVRVEPDSLDGRAQLWLAVIRPGGRRGFDDNMDDHPIAEGCWAYYDIVGDVAPDAKFIALGLGMLGAGQAWFDDVSLTVLGATDVAKLNRGTLRSLDGPGVIRATAQASVKAVVPGRSGTVTFPIPGTYRDQVPLSFRLTVTPPSAFQGCRWRKRPDGLNWLCDVSVAPPAQGAIIRWQELVLVGERNPAHLPPAATPVVPDQAAPWTRATACVQSGDPAIQAEAARLSHDSPDIATYARRVMNFTAANRGGKTVKWDSLDASKALVCGGTCTNRANLAAALLRARGIPARTVSHLPAWTNGQKLYEHWLTEYWHPGVGWVWMEPTMDQSQPSPTGVVVLSVSSTDDEDKAFDPIHERLVMPGAAYLSVAELSPELQDGGLFDTDAINLATPVARIGGSPAQMRALFAHAATAFDALARHAQAGQIADAPDPARLLSAALTGQASTLNATLRHP